MAAAVAWGIYRRPADAPAAIGRLPAGIPAWGLMLLVPAYAFGASGWPAIWLTILSELAGPNYQGRALGLGSAFPFAVASLGTPLLGLIVDRSRQWSLAWTVLAGLLVVAGCLVFAVREGKRESARAAAVPRSQRLRGV